MKKILTILLIISTLLFVSCYQQKHPIAEEPQKDEPKTEVEISGVQYIRTNGVNDIFEYPRLIRISSRKSLDYYLSSFNGIYSLGKREKLYSDSTIGFADAIEKYDSEYFESYDLYLAVIEEGSGSIRHLVEDAADGYVEIVSLIPETAGIEDMAEWHIIIEVNKGASLIGINDKKTSVYTPEEIYAEFLEVLKRTALDYLKEYGFTEVQLSEFTRTDFGTVNATGFENPLGYSPGYSESPVWMTTVLDAEGKIELYLCDAPFVFGYKSIPS